MLLARIRVESSTEPRRPLAQRLFRAQAPRGRHHSELQHDDQAGGAYYRIGGGGSNSPAPPPSPAAQHQAEAPDRSRVTHASLHSSGRARSRWQLYRGRARGILQQGGSQMFLLGESFGGSGSGRPSLSCLCETVKHLRLAVKDASNPTSSLLPQRLPVPHWECPPGEAVPASGHCISGVVRIRLPGVESIRARMQAPR